MRVSPSRRDILSGVMAGFGGHLVGDGAAVASQVNAFITGQRTDPNDIGGDAELISVRSFGARGDFDPARLSGTDDTAAVNRAMAQLSAGKTLFFPPGRYKISAAGRDQWALMPLPVGASVYMADGAWIHVDNRAAVVTLFAPLGNNNLRVNIDGQSIPANADVAQSGAWTNECAAIRSFADERHGRGAAGVTVYDSVILNCGVAIQTDGASGWKIINNRIGRIKNSAILMGYSNGHDCRNNLIADNVISETGDTAVAFYKVTDLSGQTSHNIVARNSATDHNLLTQGFAFDVESNRAGGQSQHHFLFIGNMARQTRSGLSHGTGAAVMNHVSHSMMIGNMGHSAQGSNGDYGFAMSESRHSLITNNHATGYRAGGICIDGCVDCHSRDNQIVDCGGLSLGQPALLLALAGGGLTGAYPTRGVTSKGDTICFSGDYRHYFREARAVTVTTSGSPAPTVSEVEIGELTINGCAGAAPISVIGTSGARIRNVNIRNVTFNARIDLVNPTAGGPFDRSVIELTYVDQATLSGIVVDDARGDSAGVFVFRNCAGVTLASVELKGRGRIGKLYNFAESTGVRVSDVRKAADVSVETAVADAGSDTRWRNDDTVVTHAYGRASAIVSGGAIMHGLHNSPAFVSLQAASPGTSEVSVMVDEASLTIHFTGPRTASFFWEARV